MDDEIADYPFESLISSFPSFVFSSTTLQFIHGLYLFQEREQRKKEEEEQRRKETEEYRAQLAKEKMEKEFNEAVLGAKTILRQVPLGTDRNHSRFDSCDCQSDFALSSI